jgi:hypothetical protein
MDFPQYRKLSNNKAFYEIVNERTFNEIQIVGSKAFYYIHDADQYPEMLKIKEMLDLSESSIESSSKEEFQRLKLQYAL